MNQQLQTIIEKVRALPQHPMAYLVLQAPLQDLEWDGIRADDLLALVEHISIQESKGETKMSDEKREAARIAWHERARPSGNQFDGIFLDGYDAGYSTAHQPTAEVAEAVERILTGTIPHLESEASCEDYHEGFRNQYRQDVDDIRTLITAARSSPWHSIEKDGIPEERGRYLWKCRGHLEYPYSYRPYDPRMDSYDFLAGNYTHWQKIVGPPTEEADK